MKRFVALVLLACCLMMTMQPAVADYVQFAWPHYNNEVWYTSVSDAELGIGVNDGKTARVFFVTAYGNAWIQLQQTKGTCQELSYVKLWSGFIGTAKEWGKYWITVRHAETGTTKTYSWDDTYFGDTFKLEFPQSGHYVICVRPYTAKEMSDSYMMDTFVGWENPPQWWVESQSNCTYSDVSPYEK